MEGISCDWLWWTLSALMCFFRHWIFLNVLLHALHVCIVVTFFVIMCLAKKIHFIFIYLNCVCLCNSAFIHIICLCFFSFSIAFSWFLLSLLCQILIFLKGTIHMLIFILHGSIFAINANNLFLLFKFYNVEKPLVTLITQHFTEWKLISYEISIFWGFYCGFSYI